MIESLQTYAETISKDGFPQGISNAHRCILRIWSRMSHLSHIGSNFACCRPEHRSGRDPQGSVINFDDAPPPYRFWSAIAVKVAATCHRFAATAPSHLPAASGDGLNRWVALRVTIWASFACFCRYDVDSFCTRFASCVNRPVGSAEALFACVRSFRFASDDCCNTSCRACLRGPAGTSQLLGVGLRCISADFHVVCCYCRYMRSREAREALTDNVTRP